LSISRFVAAQEDDDDACGEYVGVAWLVAPLLSVLLAIAAVVAAGPLAHAVGGISTGRMRIVLCSSVALFGLFLFSNALWTYAVGRRRMVAANIASTVGATANFVASVGSIALGANLIGYVLANVGAGVVALLIDLVMVMRYEGLPPIRRPRIATLRELLAYSLKTQLVQISSLVNFQTDKIVIGFSIGTAAAGAYELANRAALAVREIGIWVTSGVALQLTADLAEHGMDAVRRRYARLTTVTVAVGLAPILAAVATGPLLLAVWLDQVPEYSTAVLVTLCAAYLPAATTGVSYGVALAANRPGIVARTSIVSALVNLVLTVSLAPIFGIWGVLAGTAVALVGGQIAQVVAVHREFALSTASYVDAVWPPLRVYAVLAVPVGLFCWGVHIHGRITGAVVLVALGGAYLSACLWWAARARRLPQAVLTRLPGARASSVVSG
jgi:PST family polysaccharide transporter